MSRLAVCLWLVLALLAAAAGQAYKTWYDNINLDQVLNNDRLLNTYVNCLLDRGNCSPDGLELKRDIPDALQTHCAKCSAKQREGTDKVIRFLIEKKPQVFQQLERKYDPTGYYRRVYQDELGRRRTAG